MRRLPLLLLPLAAACSAPRSSVRAASAPPPVVAPATDEAGVALGLELRAYPAGVAPALYGEVPVAARGVVTFDLGANLTDRGDWGEHEQEDGAGPGVGVGYRHYLSRRGAGWFLGGRVDLWSLAIDWEDPGTSGDTDVLVLQPTVEAGYTLRLDERWRCNVFAALGAEVNVDTDGEDVGDGAIGLLGVSFVTDF